MGARRHADRRFFRRQARTQREAAADAFGDRHHVGGDVRPFMREQLAGPAHAGLDLIEQQQQAVFVTDRAQRPQVVGRTGTDAALALDWLDRDAGLSLVMAARSSFMLPKAT